jgi:hypothetical protein
MDEIVVARVQHEQALRLGEQRRQRPEIWQRERIDQPDAAVRRADLDQRQALGIVMQAVAFGVERQRRRRGQLAHGLREVGGLAGPADGGQIGGQDALVALRRASIDCCIRSKRRLSGSSPSSCVMTYSSPRRMASSTMPATASGAR